MNYCKKAWLKPSRGLFLSFVLVLTSCRLEPEEKSPEKGPDTGAPQRFYLGDLSEIDGIEFDFFNPSGAKAYGASGIWDFKNRQVTIRGECSHQRDMTLAESEIFRQILEYTHLCLLVRPNDVTPVQQRMALPADIIKFVWKEQAVEIHDVPIDSAYGDFVFCSEQSFSFLRSLTGMLRKPDDGTCLDHAN